MASNKRYKDDVPTVLYYLRFDDADESYYKIGITSLSVTARYAHEPLPYEILDSMRFDSWRDANAVEKDLLYRFDEDRLIRHSNYYPLLNGNTELFIEDVVMPAGGLKAACEDLDKRRN